ncbi:hypothetical protein KUTeg_012093 [Tegillarca granosa]|uniref:DUF6589 domain-containing protein n=1 Tax=Tegillarca granosa TaxID=220873 RepID=A0ABQ9F3R8_TEGGR|nr:hypothetical protein KUTeg_012093 [Tegillarca granosa]
MTTSASHTETENKSSNGGNVQESSDTTSNISPVPLYDVNRQYYFDVTFDNVNQKVGVRHHVRGKQNKMLNMVQSYATLERVGSYGLSNIMPSAETIDSIPLTDILPTVEDEFSLREELSIMISRILQKFIPAFSNLETISSIPHQYSEVSARKSEIVPLGILNKGEASTAGMIDILESFKEYVPRDRNGKPLPLLLYCDGLSCERVEGAQRARINGEDKWARLDMFEPAIQEWHRRLMYLQDTYDELFNFESHREKGTLYNLKHVFDHRGVSKNIMECFNHADELLDFATEGYAVLYAMELGEMETITDTPCNFPEDPEGKKHSTGIASVMKFHPNTTEVLNVAVERKLEKSEYCICRLNTGGTMIYCCNNTCQRGGWFHLECLGMLDDDVPDDKWF